MPSVDVFYVMDKERPFFQEHLRAYHDNTKYPHSFYVHCQPGTTHENVQRCLDKSVADRIVLIDDDCMVLPSSPDWLEIMMRTMDEYERCAICVPVECKTPEVLAKYLADPTGVLRRNCNVYPQPIEYAWLPSYCFMIDRTRVPSIYADTSIPQPVGMTDLDMSLQATELGWDCLAITEFAVYHRWKEYDVHTSRVTDEYNRVLHQWAAKKWKTRYTSITKFPGMILT